jgi:putative NADH-flavin reductase
MKVVLFGATGYAGREVLNELLQNNHQVTAVTRSSSRINIQDQNLTIKEGNVLDEETLNSILKGQDAVINCLGIGGKGNGLPNHFVSSATTKIVREMESQEIKRFICLSNVGAGDSAKSQPWIFRKIILPYFMKWLHVIIDDKNIMEPEIMKSKLDWTIVRCPNIIDKKPKGKIKTSLSGKGLRMSITKKELAGFLVGQLESDNFLRKCPSISN